MRLVLFDMDPETRARFRPLALSRPIWELRCGMGTLAETLVRAVGASEVACFVPDYMAAAYREQTDWPVNTRSSLTGADLLMLDGTVQADEMDFMAAGPSEVGVDLDGGVLYARIAMADLAVADNRSAVALLAWAKANLPNVPCFTRRWRWLWDLIERSPAQVTADFVANGQVGRYGSVDESCRILGSESDLFVDASAEVGPGTVIDTRPGPVYLDADVQVRPFSHLEGPCYVGPGTILYAVRLGGGTAIGPNCRLGGEIASSIFQGHANKYHNGFLGHAYVGEWVNLGAGTNNSDLRNDYGSVSAVLDGVTRIDTGSIKLGAMIGDHAKTSIGTLLNTGAYVGAMAMVVATGRLAPKFLPSFSCLKNGRITDEIPREALYETAETVMARRGRKWTPAQGRLWDAVFDLTAEARRAALDRQG